MNNAGNGKYPPVVTIVLAQNFLPGGGGQEVSIYHLSQEILKRGLSDVEIVCFSRQERSAAEEFDRGCGIPVHRIKDRRLRLSDPKKVTQTPRLYGGIQGIGPAEKIEMAVNAVIWFCRLLPATASRVKANRGKVVILQCYTFTAILAALICRRLIFSKEMIGVTFINGVILRRSGFRLADLVFRRLLLSVDASLCVSRASAEALISEFRLVPEKVRPYKLWIDTDALDRQVDIEEGLRRPYAADNVRVLFVGRVIADKGVREIMRLAAHIDDRGLSGRYSITMIGDSEDQICRELSAFAKTSKCLRYLGRVDQPELWKHYLANDIFLMSSVWTEGSGNVNLEAYAFGLPVVGTDVGGVPEYIREFRHHRVIGDLKPATILRAVDGLFGEMRRAGRMAVFNESRAVLREKYSTDNFSVHQEVYERLIERLRRR